MDYGIAAKLARQCNEWAAQIKAGPLTIVLLERCKREVEKATYGIPLGVSLVSTEKRLRNLEKRS